jgi:hypothetical protein
VGRAPAHQAEPELKPVKLEQQPAHFEQEKEFDQ